MRIYLNEFTLDNDIAGGDQVIIWKIWEVIF